ncbi:MAG TPA: hypothetical protein VEB40_05120 [Flavipsychrobacter sp.]|nr:hypothetical protein [Flavipsychrobacter sp.]
MDKQKEDKKVKWARLAGSVYFLLLGLGNFTAMTLNNKLSWKDFVLLVFLATPLILRKKFYYLFFGALATCFWVYMLYEVFQMHVLYVREVSSYNNPHLSPAQAFSIGYLFTGISICFSLMLVYAGTRPGTKKEEVPQ